jgi:beta-phosphoglucomutase family hydrolase
MRRMAANVEAGSNPQRAADAPPITRAHFDAVLFDLDGVLTSTAGIHASAWKRMFDDYLRKRAEARGEAFRPFDVATDYIRYVDGRPRYEGVQKFLESRGIRLPRGTPASPPEEESVCGLGNVKDQMVQQAIAAGKVQSFPSSVEFARLVRDRGLRTAVVTSSRNCTAVLRAAGMTGLFEAQVDGNTIEEQGLRGKPAPDSFLRAAELLGVEPKRAVVVEDAIAGVEAGKAGGFGLVIGIDRHGDGDALRRHGADVVVTDLAALL